jgi:hypothetical protein
MTVTSSLHCITQPHRMDTNEIIIENRSFLMRLQD